MKIIGIILLFSISTSFLSNAMQKNQYFAAESSPNTTINVQEPSDVSDEECESEPKDMISNTKLTTITGFEGQLFVITESRQSTKADRELMLKQQALQQQISQGKVVPFRVRVTTDNYMNFLSQKYLITKKLYYMFHENSPHKDDIKNNIYHCVVTVAQEDLPKLEEYKHAVSKERLAQISNFDLNFFKKPCVNN